MYIDRDFHARMQLFNFLDRVCQELELTDAQFDEAKARYEGVGRWIAASPNPLLTGAQIYLQGSVALGTTVRPIGRSEYDVDLICFAPQVSTAYPPQTLKRVIGDKSAQNGNYATLLEEKPRCWRLDYANEFHLDVTPAIRNPACWNGGELVPEKGSNVWKPSNPKGYRRIFEERSKLQPTILAQMRSPRTDSSQGRGLSGADAA